ncbi:SGNH/GDSL hydrolase family protein [Paenibacillus ginsengarvi]|uniref:GDSL family lipase n=1 Tax=Paenibacillus ginsengarvi TaxID=400777 RepID=A0A3B0CH67_9BACL|nr:SGNH/GDSL hydrolase family protein [Paenibacillus ginsengarvi]RKN83769.1 GDSL family lipase [Paenibacillus ginsengarvi]
MQSIEVNPSLFKGAVSLEQLEDGIRPWRINYKHYELFPPNGINGTAILSAGIRLRFASDTTTVSLEVAPVQAQVQFDLVSGDAPVLTQVLEPGETTLRFEQLPAQDKLIEIYLPQKSSTVVRAIGIDDNASLHIPEDTRPKWITYGSSITQCNAAFSPAFTWPAIVARRFGLDLTCLGYSGNCHLEPMVARTIRDLDADVISLCMGINVYGGSTLNKRTFRAAVIGFIQIVREKHPDTPIIVMSPIWSPPRETTPNTVGFTLAEMREEVEAAVAAMEGLGDQHLHYVHGHAIFDESYAEHLPDNLHPNGQGYAIMGQNFGDKAMQQVLAEYGLNRGFAITNG